MKILLSTCRYPWPARRGDQLRATQLLEFLSSEHEVTLLVPRISTPAQRPSQLSPQRLETYRVRRGLVTVSALARAIAGGQPMQSGLFFQPDLARKLRQLAGEADMVILQLVRQALHLKDVVSTPVVVDLIDSLSLNFTRRAAVDRPWLRPLLRAEARRLATAERRMIQRSVAALVVCERDRQALLSGFPEAMAARLHVVPMASVELGRSDPAVRPTPLETEAERRPELILTGNLGYFPTADGLVWWMDAVWQHLRRRRPDLRLTIAGERPTARLRRATRRAGARLVESPPDLRPLLAGATVALAPMRCGSGQPLKILEAWSAGVPVVASAWAAAGVAGCAGEDLLVADSPDDWIEAILSLLQHTDRRQHLVTGGRRRLARDFSPAGVRRRVLDLVRLLPNQ